MDCTGNIITKFIGTGAVKNPSLAFSNEENTGIFLDGPQSSSAFTVTKRGTKRIRVDDSGTTFYGTTNIPAATCDTVSLILGSETAPSLNFQGHTQSGLYSDTGGSLYFTRNGTDSLYCGVNSCGSFQPFTAETFLAGLTDVKTPKYGFYSGSTTPDLGLAGLVSGTTGILSLVGNGVAQVVTSTVGTLITPPLTTSSDITCGGQLSVPTVLSGKVLIGSGGNYIGSSSYTPSDLAKNSNFFGDGSDGNVGIGDGSTTTLTRDMHYTTLTLANSSVIYTAGYRIFATTAITGDGTGIIQYNGSNGVGQTALSSNNNTAAFGSLSGTVGGGAVNTAPSALGAINVVGSPGGHGGDSDTKLGGNGNSITKSTTFLARNIYYLCGSGTSFQSSCGGGSGAGGSSHVGGTGGQGGGSMLICANSIGNILLQSRGGQGAPAGGATGGVGGGGGGGFVALVYKTFLNSWNPAVSINVSGGAIGPAPGVTTSATAGSTGNTMLIQIT